jgi:STE24 endopeptidase
VRRPKRLLVVVVAAVVVAEAAVLVMRPATDDPPTPPPAPVSAGAYFSAPQVERARDYRRPNLVLYGATLAIELGVLVALVRRPPRWLARGARRPVLAGAAAAAGVSAALTLASLPVSAIARQRAIDVGLSTRSWPGWAWDVALGTAIGAGIAAVGGALLVLALRRLGRRWWIAGAAGVVAFGIATTMLSPVLIEPLFNRFEPLPRGETRSAVLDLARRAGVEVGEVYVMDASKRTTGANAYVAGLGRTKRVVIYDTLLRDFTPAEVRHVVAHELGHVAFSDVPRGILWLAIVAPFGMLAVARLAERFGPDDWPARPAAAVPAVALAIALVVPVLTFVSNQLSRQVEARADAYALELTRDPETMIGFQRRIALSNVSDPEPPRWATFLLATHPPPLDRIGAAVAIAERQRAEGEPPGGAGQSGPRTTPPAAADPRTPGGS